MAFDRLIYATESRSYVAGRRRQFISRRTFAARLFHCRPPTPPDVGIFDAHEAADAIYTSRLSLTLTLVSA